MKVRMLLTGMVLGLGVATLSGCVVYPEPVGVAVQAPVVVRPAPYYYHDHGYGPRYDYPAPYRRW